MHSKFLLAASALLLLGGVNASPAAAAPDDGLFATYTGSTNSVNFTVCGSVPGSSGCYGAGGMSPFDNACAVLEGAPDIAGNVVTRAVYILDKRSTKTAIANLYVYERIITINAPYASIQTKFIKQVPLGIPGGAGAKCSLAGNVNFVYAGTSDGGAVSVGKKGLAVTPMGSGPLVDITSDTRGYISLNFSGSFNLVNPHGQSEQVGGGNVEMISTRNALKN